MRINFLPDIPIEIGLEDYLGFKDFVELLQSSINHTQTPFVYGVLGTWGCGKTSILKLLKNLLEKDLECGSSSAVPIWFNAWEYENETNLLYPLLYSVKRDYETRLKVQSLSKEFGKFFMQIVTASTLTLADVGLRAITKALIGDAVKLEDIDKHLENLKEHSSEIEKTLSSWTDEVGNLRTGFEKLLETYAREYPFKKQEVGEKDARFVILIDDLDRCLPETVISILEKIKNFLSVERCIFVLALNPKVVQQGIRFKYHGLDIDGREYLEKILNYSFYVPAPDDEHTEHYCRKSLERLVEQEDISKYSRYFDRFGQILCDCHFSNPRKIKRILNHYLFFIKINEQELDQYHLPNIIRFIILAEYYPSVFELFLQDAESAKEKMQEVGTPGFSVKEFEDQFGVPILGNAAQLGQMKSLFDLPTSEGIKEKNLSDHAKVVFRILRLS